jgi:predicted RNase H-like HicB family nuclease
VAAAATREEVKQLITEAISFHLEGMLLDNEPIPQPGYWSEELEIPEPVIPASAPA